MPFIFEGYLINLRPTLTPARILPQMDRFDRPAPFLRGNVNAAMA